MANNAKRNPPHIQTGIGFLKGKRFADFNSLKMHNSIRNSHVNFHLQVKTQKVNNNTYLNATNKLIEQQ